MTWTKIDDEDTEASWDLSDGAYRLHHSGLVYCNHHITDGHVPASRLAVLMPAYDPAFLAELLAAGKWGAVTGGYQVANFLRDQPSKSEVMARREKNRADVAEWRRNHPSKPVSKPVTEREFSSERERDPVPVPVPGVRRLQELESTEDSQPANALEREEVKPGEKQPLTQEEALRLAIAYSRSQPTPVPTPVPTDVPTTKTNTEEEDGHRPAAAPPRAASQVDDPYRRGGHGPRPRKELRRPDNYDELKQKFDENLAAETAKHST
jgi:hypothetical protein